MKKLLFLMFLMLSMTIVSCTDNRTLIEKMDYIKEVGDTNPQLAMKMADSLETIVRDKPEKVIMKYDLLKIRLQDKAYITATSDITIKRVLAYYENHGNNLEKQEAYYYAGSVYRDLQDTPRALENFLKSSEIAEEDTMCNQIMLRNAYSNLCVLYLSVQAYKEYYHMALKLYRFSRKIGKMELSTFSYIGSSLIILDSLKQACKYFLMSLDTIEKMPVLHSDADIIINLLYNFSYFRDKANASRCLALFNKLDIDNDDKWLAIGEYGNKYLAIGEYYEMIGKKDSAIIAYKRILEKEDNILKKYDAAKALLYLYHQEENLPQVDKYAKIYLQISDSIDLGKRQEMAATVNNAFQYHRDEHREQHIKEENARMRTQLTMAVAVAIAFLLSGFIIFLYKRNRSLKALVKASKELERLSADKKKLADGIATKEEELAISRDHLEKSKTALVAMQKQLDDIEEDLDNANRNIKEKEGLLAERIEQNKSLFNLLHKSGLEGQAEEVIQAVRKSAEGKQQLTAADWEQLYKAVDKLYPTFKNQLLEKEKRITEDKMKFCYLMRIGLLNPQIENIMPMSRATIWRWSKRYEWILTWGSNQKKV